KKVEAGVVRLVLSVYYRSTTFVFVCLTFAGQVVYAHQFVNLTGENLTNNSLFEEHLCNLLSDLTGLAMGKYSNVRPTEALTSHHYHCTCTKELWILLIHLLEHRSKVLHTQVNTHTHSHLM
uniref:Protein MMS22-like N-terminal domain-containing protein n=1 Tax=Hucho hucho TaxID=62062 RepID=A0A4W5JPF0_9TELE